MFRAKHIAAVANGNLGGTGAWSTLGSVCVNTGAASAVLTLYEGQSTSGPVVAIIDCSAIRCVVFYVECKDGIHWVLSGGNADITITHR